MREISGFPHVAFVPNRRDALALALASQAPQPVQAANTHQRWLLPFATAVRAVDHEGIAQFTSEGTVLLQAANAETGVIDRGSAAFTVLDATATFGRVPISGSPDIVIADARAWGSPIDIALVLSQQPIEPSAGVQVSDVTVAIDQLTRVWQHQQQRSSAEAAAMQACEAQILRSVPDVDVHGTDRVPHIRSFSVLHLDGETLMRALDVAGYVVGSGSACVQDGTPSHVLAAMGGITHGNIRLALPTDLELEVLDDFAATLATIVTRLRREAGVADL